jgi:hypothetical protein
MKIPLEKKFSRLNSSRWVEKGAAWKNRSDLFASPA